MALTEPPLRAQVPIITNQPSSRVVWAGCNVAFTVGVSGTGPFSYQWQFNGTNLSNNIISTVAGNGGNGYSGDGGPATNATLGNIQTVSLDKSGNMYLPDGPLRVRKVDISGIINTVAGGGTNGLGDGGPATNASLGDPSHVAVDDRGNWYIPDLGNQRVRKVDTNGIISTVAGTGTNGFSGDGGPATNANLAFPAGVALDALKNLYIADDSNHRVRRVDTDGIISTFAGNGTNGYTGDGGLATNASLYSPYRLAFNPAGNLFLIDGYPRVRMIDTNGIITTVAGNGTSGFSGDGGQATNATLSSVRDLAADADNNLFIADTGSGRIRRVDATGVITTVAGGGSDDLHDGIPATSAYLYTPYGVAVDVAGNLFIAELNGHKVRKVTNNRGPILALNEVTVASAGDYQVVVTGSGGSVTSSVATLTVATSPLVSGVLRNSDGSVSLNFVSPPNSTNTVLVTTSLSAPVLWQPLATNPAGADGAWLYLDTSASNFPARLYRSMRD
ncbi:MAG: hypothetical protein C5B50_29830 [Verrucomicrobia bacterium]|nr:MAG: hypothetical protein C5B50_29830 [Verrucomicrobiota bacterium]